MPGPKTPDTAPGSQYPLPLGQGKEPKPKEWVDPVQKKLAEQIANGFARTAEQLGISSDLVQHIVQTYRTDSSRVFELIKSGKNPDEAIGQMQREKQNP